MNELMSKVIQQINLTPQSWHQSEWVVMTDREEVAEGDVCGTSMCVAGWALLLSGEARQHIVRGYDQHVEDVRMVWADDTSENPESIREYEYQDHGAVLLGLDEEQARLIFMNTRIEDPQVMTNHIKAVLEGLCAHDNSDLCSC